MQVGYIDTHAHLYDESFKEDIDGVVSSALDKGVSMALMPNCDVESLVKMLALETEHPAFFRSMIGLHPTYVKENFKEQLSKLEEAITQHSFCAIGECGLDYYWDKTFVNQQKEAFQVQIEWAKQYKLPIVIHTRDSVKDGIDMIGNALDENLVGVFHCFSGSLIEAEKILEMGFYLGIGGVSTFKNGGLNEVIASTPLSNMILETDAPYLAPSPHRGKRNESAFIPIIAAKIAEIKNVTVEEVAMVTTQNAYELFKLKDSEYGKNRSGS